jgi:hypothetical protein
VDQVVAAQQQQPPGQRGQSTLAAEAAADSLRALAALVEPVERESS